MAIQKKIIHSPQEMFDVGVEMAKKCRVVLLEGQLWAGKTTFIKWFASWLGINPQTVTSPTYTYIQTYENKLLHIDMYNIIHFQQLVEKGIVELMHDYDFIAIEWPKFMDQTWLENTVLMSIEKGEGDDRNITVW